MKLISQHAKAIMEECKVRARDAGLRFDDDSLEYIVTNRDMLELTPKHMIPTLYDYWVHDIELLKEQGKYELYPNNPYETVINSRPAISFYNDNNPDWLNVMIFYHVLGHIDFFQNNTYFKHTWDDDFVGMALADKRLLTRLRSEHGRWVDYVIEFARGIDNIVGYYETLDRSVGTHHRVMDRVDYYFDIFLQKVKGLTQASYMKEIDRFNKAMKDNGSFAEDIFFKDVKRKYPEFESMHGKYLEQREEDSLDLLSFLNEHSPFLNTSDNRWMKSVLEIIRKTSLYFQPQIRTKIINEGWASYWHEKLFLQDERIRGFEVDFARIHARVTGVPQVGLNPYAIGLRMIQDIELRAEKGQLSWEFQSLLDADSRKHFDKHTGKGMEALFKVREDFCDFSLINTFCDQDFVDRHKLFVVDRRLNQERRTWEYYVKSKKGEDYKQMLLESLFHPPHISIHKEHTKASGELCLIHEFEGKPLVREYIDQVLLGVSFLWGGPVSLETTLVSEDGSERVLFRMNEQILEQVSV